MYKEDRDFLIGLSISLTLIIVILGIIIFAQQKEIYRILREYKKANDTVMYYIQRDIRG